MKTLTLALLLSFVGQQSASAAPVSKPQPKPAVPPPVEQFYANYDRDVAEVLFVSQGLPSSLAVQGWRRDLQNLKPYLQRELPQLKGKTLHVILQAHDAGAEQVQDPEVVASPAKTLETLNKLKPKLLTIEGSYMEKFNRESFVAEMNTSVSEILSTFGGGMRAKPSELYDLYLKHNTVLRYANDHPECHTIGGEWRGVHVLDLVMGFPGAPPAAEHAFHTGSRIRTWMTAARIGEFMRRDHLKEGTIVIGRNHRSDFELLGKLFGVKVVFYET